MIPRNNTARIASNALLLSLLVWLYLYYNHSQQSPSRIRSAEFHSQEEFLEDWLRVAGTPSDASAISSLCNRSNQYWRPNLVLRLDDANGGVGNVRGNILDFLYFAISAGASIVLPRFATRSTTDLSSLWEGSSPFEMFFDKDLFLGTLRSRCPQMVIYDSQTERNLPVPLDDRFLPASMRSDLDPAQTPESGLEQFNAWLATHDVKGTPDSLTVIKVQRTLFNADTRSLPFEVRRDFGDLLRLNPKVRRLAGIATYNLARRFDLHIDPAHPYYTKAFFGAHLRTEWDAEKAGWLDESLHLSLENQSSTYLEQANEHGLGVLYCASGSAGGISAFKHDAWHNHRINVTHKADLLEDVDLFRLQQMTWDQQALVDYEILTRSTYFAGIVKSTFSYNIALRRNLAVEEEGRNMEKHWYKPQDMDNTLAFQDSLSTIWGRDEGHEEKIPRGMWP